MNVIYFIHVQYYKPLLVITFSRHFAVPDPCQTLPCDRNAVCTREGLLSGNFTCECQPPYTVGNGFECSCELKYPVHLCWNLHELNILV